MSYDDRLANYVEVATRLRELRERWPAASLGPADPRAGIASADEIAARRPESSAPDRPQA